jgi:Ni,Fe-hydrogenase maturation factor
MKTLILRVGNSIFSDDGVGLRVAAGLKSLADHLNPKNLISRAKFD